MICPYCGEEIQSSYLKSKIICQSCYIYTKNGGEIHAIPDPGTIVTDENDNVVCHICGQAHSKLGSHIAHKHHMSTKEYKDQFDIPQNCSLASRQHQAKMREYNIQYREHVVYDNLINKGRITRFQSGQTPIRRYQRKKKPIYVSLANADTTSE